MQSPRITLISTVHKEIGKCISFELSKIIESIKPDVIFLEAFENSYTNYHNMLLSQFVINYPDQVDIIKRPLLSFICPIAYSLDLLNQIASAGLISKQKIFRPIVSLAQASSGSTMRSFFGRSDDEWERYAITFQANLEIFSATE